MSRRTRAFQAAAIFLAAAAGQASTSAAPADPSFGTFAVPTPSIARHAGVLLADAKSRQYAHMLHDAASRKPNFAGHYILASWGCGASCVMAAAIDAQTGVVTWLPFTVCCWAQDIAEPLEFKPDSRLLIVHGSRDERGGGTHFYQFKSGAFAILGADAP